MIVDWISNLFGGYYQLIIFRNEYMQITTCAFIPIVDGRIQYFTCDHIYLSQLLLKMHDDQ